MDNIPASSEYAAHLTKLGLSEEEIVAVASLEAFGTVKSKNQIRWSNDPKLDSFYFKELLTPSTSMVLPHKDTLVNTPSLRSHVENFAESQKSYNAALKTGFVKLCNLGTGEEHLHDIESFLLDDPNFKLKFPQQA